MNNHELREWDERITYREIFGKALCKICGDIWDHHSEVGDYCPEGHWYSRTSKFEIYLPDDFQ